MSGHFCPNCGDPVQPEVRFCPNCGQALTPVEPAAAVSPEPPPPTLTAVSDASASVPEPAPTEQKRQAPVVWVSLVALLLILGGLGVAVLLTRDKKDVAAGSADNADVVVLEPVAVEVPNPFTASVAVDEAAVTPTTAPAPSPSGTADSSTSTGAGGGVVRGSAPGLYGGTRDQQACDPAKLVAFLESDPAKAKAWAKVQGIQVGEIPDFIKGLTPVLLRRDTRVVNYGYRDGRATAYPAVLQAGSAVLVDEYGVPRAKCSCGNPLTEAKPVTTRTRYKGAKWPGFKPDLVVVVKVDVKISSVILVDGSGTPFSRPTGTSGVSDTDVPGTSSGSEPGPVAGTSEGTTAPKLGEIGSIQGVSNGPRAPTVLKLPAARITAIMTYHWNNATGAAPGTIGLRSADGTLYGPFRTTGSPGQGGVPNAYWTAVINYRIPAGTYTVVDSSPATWAWASDTGGRGMVTVWGVAEGGGAASPSSPALSGERAGEAKRAITSRYCGGFSQYVTWVHARETESQLYRVEVHIALDSGEWTAKFDVDFATEGGPDIRPLNNASADLLC